MMRVFNNTYPSFYDFIFFPLDKMSYDGKINLNYKIF